jgi:cytochrome P450
MWHNSRQLIRPQFIKDRVSDLNTFETHFQALLPLLEGSLPGSTVRVDDLFFRFTLDAATDFLLGNSVNSLENPRVEFAEAFAEVQHVQAVIARAGPAQALVPKKGFYKSLKVLNSFVEKYVDQALALSPAELEAKTKSDHGYTFLHALASYTRDRTVLRDQLVAILLAGRDTTAVTLSWLFYSLSQHPEVVAALRQEIFATLGPDQTTKPTYEHLKSMRYLQHTMNETLRLYPVVPYNVRVALKDTTLPRGGGPDGSQPLAVLKDTPIGYSTLILQHRKDLYPTTYPSDSEKAFPDPQKFDPSRWDSWTPKSWTYVPFNGGPRICIGQQFALTEMGYTVVRILQQFSGVEDRSGGEFPGWKTDIVLQPANGVHVAFTRGEK